MSMLDRYKKGNGIVELVKLIEESVDAKKTQLINMVRAEDPDFAAKVESRLLNWEKVKTLPEGAFAEVISSTPAKFIATAIVGEAPAFITMVEKCLGKLYNEYKQEKDALTQSPPNAGQIDTARKKIIGETRKLEMEGKIKFAPADASQVSTTTSGSEGLSQVQKLAPVNSVIYGNSGSSTGASAEEGCPQLDSFRLENPPPGLSGERLETYFKTLLGF